MNKIITAQLVSKAIGKFALRKQLLKHKIQTRVWHPDIVIARDPGSGGRPIAQKLAKKLKWRLMDEGIMNKLADELDIPAKEFAHIDEHSRNWFNDLFNAIFNPNYVSDTLYLKHLKHLLLKTAKKGDVVIVGRGANHILPSNKCLRVRVTASFSTRVKNTMKHEGKTKDEATAWVEHVESKRTNFIRQYFGVNPYNPWHYDIVINTDQLSLLQARDLIISAYLAKFPTERRRLNHKK